MNTKFGFKELNEQATAFVRQNRGAVLPNSYVPGEGGLTKEKAIARALEADPQVYADFRRAHNAASLVRQLQDAGFELKRA